MHRIETAVARFYRANPGINNYTVMRAYDAANEHYRAVARGTVAKPSLTGLDAALYDSMIAACEEGLKGGFKYEGRVAEALEVEELRFALRKLRKSVDFHHNQSGRMGYLEYIVQFFV